MLSEFHIIDFEQKKFGNLAGNTTKIVTVGTDGKLNAKSGGTYTICYRIGEKDWRIKRR